MGATALVTVEDYLRSTEKPAQEFRDGVVTAKPMPTYFHGLIQFVLVSLLRARGLAAAPEVTLRLSPSRFLVPDVIAARELSHPYPTAPVELCCEILSPEDRLGATFSKCEEYHEWGVPNCWVIDPEKRTAWQYPKDGEPTRVTESLEAGEIIVPLAELFSILDQQPKN